MNAITLHNVGKKFTLSGMKDRTVKFFSSLPPQRIVSELWALRNINLEIESGKVIGVIGRNGAGKTTLLNILAGIAAPTTGEARINGKVSSILTLGAGFQDELTGRENIYLNSSILSISRDEINKKYRSIVEFSELDGFLDYPLKAYSQGMRLRLGFSVAIHLGFDILLIDEIFSVGDVSFQKKCFDKIEGFKKEGKTLVVSSQSMDVIDRMCDEAVLLENGEIIQRGGTQKVIAAYMEALEKKKFSDVFRQRYCMSRWWADKRFWDSEEGSKEARITKVSLQDGHGRETNKFKPSERMIVKAFIKADQEIDEPHFGVAVFREDGVYCYGPNTHLDGYKIAKIGKGEGFFSIEYKSLCLGPGKYRLSVAIWDKNELWAYDYHSGCYKFEVTGENADNKLLELSARWEPDAQKFSLFGHKGCDTVFGAGREWKDKADPDGEIVSVETTDGQAAKDILATGEDMAVKVRLKLTQEHNDRYLWLGVFRNDDVYCHGAVKKISEETVSLLYPKFPLLTGDYYLSAGIWQKGRREPKAYCHKIRNFRVSFLGEDHGTAYLAHSWNWKLP